MGGFGQPAATIRPGAVRAIFDHLAVSLTADGRPGSIRFVFSHYRFRWSDDGVIGDLVFAETIGPAGPERRVVTDAPELAEVWATTLAPGAWAAEDARRAPIAGAVTASPIVGGSVRETLAAEGIEVDVALDDLGPPILASGAAPRLPSRDIVSVLLEAGSVRASVDGREISDRPFTNDAWIGWLGRPLRSAVLAIGEILVDRE